MSEFLQRRISRESPPRSDYALSLAESREAWLLCEYYNRFLHRVFDQVNSDTEASIPTDTIIWCQRDTKTNTTLEYVVDWSTLETAGKDYLMLQVNEKVPSLGNIKTNYKIVWDEYHMIDPEESRYRYTSDIQSANVPAEENHPLGIDPIRWLSIVAESRQITALRINEVLTIVGQLAQQIAYED